MLKIGHFFISKLEFFILKISVQIKSLGNKSGVNWILLKPKSTHLLKVEIVNVFASQGIHSSKICHPQIRQIIVFSIKSFCQKTFFDISIFSSFTFCEAS